MMELINLIWGHPVESLLILLAEYTVMMKLHHKMHNKYLHMVMGAIFQPQNAIFNATIISVVGWELPQWNKKEWFTTLRMRRWKTLDPDTHWWRYGFASKLCSLLNWSDTGHC